MLRRSFAVALLAAVLLLLGGCTSLLGDFSSGPGGADSSTGGTLPESGTKETGGGGTPDATSDAAGGASDDAGDGAVEAAVVPTYTVTISVASAADAAAIGAGTVAADVQTSLDGGADAGQPITCTGSTCTGTFAAGTMVTLTATPASGSLLSGWSGASCTGTGTCTVTVSGPVSLTATFTTAPNSISVTPAGNGSGTVVSSDGTTISCGTVCNAAETSGAMVTLSATAATGSTFVGWSGGGCAGTGTCVVTVTGTTIVTPTFVLQQLPLSVSDTGTGMGTVTSADSAINCGPKCSASYGYGANVVLTATPAAGSTFTGWTGGGCSGTGQCVVAITAATSVSAAFTVGTDTLMVASSGGGSGTIASSDSDINCGTTCSASYAYGTSVTLTATPAGGSIFSGWSGGGCTGTGSCVVSVTGATTVTANFTVSQYSLSVVPNGNGTVTSTDSTINCGTSCTSAYAQGTTVTLSAVAGTGSTFSGWSGACSGTGSCVVSITGTKTVIANFALQQFNLAVSPAGNGTGTVTSSDSSINCGSTCGVNDPYGTAVTLTATPAAGSTFAGWSGGGCTGTGTCAVTVTAATTVTATFTLQTYALSVTKTGNGAGTVTSSDNDISCGSACSYTYNYGASVTLTANAAVGSTFTGWGGACTGTGSCVTSVTAAATVTATFTLQQFTLTATGTADGTITSSDGQISCGAGNSACTATYNYGSSVTLTGAPATCYTFSAWGGACNGSSSCALTINANTSVTASWATASSTLTTTISGSGALTSTPDHHISCGSTCSASYTCGTTVTLNAQPAPGYAISGWSGGGCSGNAQTCAVNVTGNPTVTATFAQLTWDPSWSGTTDITYANGNLSAAGVASAAARSNARTTVGFTSGTHYWELKATAGTAANNNGGIGIANASFPTTSIYLGYTASSMGFGYGSANTEWYTSWAGATLETAAPPASTEIASGSIYQFALDMNAGSLWVGVNGAWVNSGNPATGANPVITGLTPNTVYPAISFYVTTTPNAFLADFGGSAFAEAVPAGFGDVQYGYNKINCGVNGPSSGFLFLEPISVLEPMTVTALGVQVTPGSTSNAILALYSSSGGPATRLAYTASTAVNAGPNAIEVTAPVSIAAGTYWVGGDFSQSSIPCSDSSASNTVEGNFLTLTYGTVPPATYPGPTSSGNYYDFGYYVTGY